MVKNYLNKKFKGIVKNTLDLSGQNENNNFSKKTFFPNLANANQNFQPDYYAELNNNIYIYDAKYYEPTSMDYKQICYSLFLSKSIKKIKDVHSALIVPSDLRNTKPHFIMDPQFNFDLKELKINIEFLDIRDVMHEWVGG